MGQYFSSPSPWVWEERIKDPQLQPKNFTLPRDEEGFVRSFNVSESDDWYAFYRKYGVVVIRDVLSEEEVERTVSDIWRVIEGQVKLKSDACVKHGMEPIVVDRNDPSTWDSMAWSSCDSGRNGIIGFNCATGTQIWANRANENIRTAFTRILGTDKVTASVDRVNFMRPTKNIKFPDGSFRDCDEWRTNPSWFHVDMDPFSWFGLRQGHHESKTDKDWEERWEGNANGMLVSEHNGDARHPTLRERAQGVVVLSDSREQDGGFQCVPGAHREVLEAWVRHRHSMEDTGLYGSSILATRPTNPFVPHAQRVPARKGSIIIWSSELFHCNYANESDRPRIAQYVKFMATEALPQFPSYARQRNAALEAFLEATDFKPTERQKEVFFLSE